MLREDGDGARATSGFRAAAGSDHAARCMVGAARRRWDRALVVRDLRHVGRIAEQPLSVRALSLPVLFSGDFRRLGTRAARSEAWLVARVAAVLPGASDPAVSRTLPGDVLLLSGCLLQSAVGRPASVHGAGAPPFVSR